MNALCRVLIVSVGRFMVSFFDINWSAQFGAIAAAIASLFFFVLSRFVWAVVLCCSSFWSWFNP